MLRRSFVLGALAAPIVGSLPASAAPSAELLPKPAMDKRGFYIEDWLHNSSGDLGQDVAIAKAAGKPLAILWEMVPCPFCTQLHEEVLVIPEMRAYVAERFYTMRLDMRGTEPVVDFNGAHRSQRDIASARRVLGTPTFSFLDGNRKELARLQYLPQKIMLAGFQFIDEGGYLKTDLNTFIRRKIAQG